MPARVRRPYNPGVAAPDSADRPAILSRDTTAGAERLQVAIWRRMTPLQKLALVNRASRDAIILALAGIGRRHPEAKARERLVRLAALRLGPELVREAYPDALSILGPDT